MWFVTSGELKGTSSQPTAGEAFIELFDYWIKAHGHHPNLGVLAAASRQGFDYNILNTTVFSTEWVLFEAKRIPRMSIEFDSMEEYVASLLDGEKPVIEQVLNLAYSEQDAILNETEIDAPNSRIDYWDDVIEVPDDYKWPE